MQDEEPEFLAEHPTSPVKVLLVTVRLPPVIYSAEECLPSELMPLVKFTLSRATVSAGNFQSDLNSVAESLRAQSVLTRLPF